MILWSDVVQTYQFLVLLRTLSFVCVCLYKHVVKHRRNDQAGNTEGKKTCRRLRDRHVKVLLEPVPATHDEGHAEDQEQVRKHATDERCLDDDNLILDQGLH